MGYDRSLVFNSRLGFQRRSLVARGPPAYPAWGPPALKTALNLDEPVIQQAVDLGIDAIVSIDLESQHVLIPQENQPSTARRRRTPSNPSS